jgi:hypothetical protein
VLKGPAAEEVGARRARRGVVSIRRGRVHAIRGLRGFAKGFTSLSRGQWGAMVRFGKMVWQDEIRSSKSTGSWKAAGRVESKAPL